MNDLDQKEECLSSDKVKEYVYNLNISGTTNCMISGQELLKKYFQPPEYLYLKDE